ncbi:MAG: DUF1150 domain-containing protein [Hyphomicrobiales bacterium]|nr:DUF1150 domain-containing protein [Hyphomicrobiales bacterium]
MTFDETTIAAPQLSENEFAALGDGEIAYIKSLNPDEAQEMYPQLEGLPEGITIFAVHGADGTPLALTDTHFAAVENAKEQNLEPVSVH